MNHLNWIHIMDQQPNDDELIIHLDAPYFDGHYPMGMRTYSQRCTFQEVLDYYKANDLENPNFWWIRAKDFPFPFIAT